MPESLAPLGLVRGEILRLRDEPAAGDRAAVRADLRHQRRRRGAVVVELVEASPGAAIAFRGRR
jgi:hypothetical protein